MSNNHEHQQAHDHHPDQEGSGPSEGRVVFIGNQHDGTYPKDCIVMVGGKVIEMIAATERIFVDKATGDAYTRGITAHGTYTKVKKAYKTKYGYAVTCDKNNKIWFIHRIIWESVNGSKVPPGLCVDHINGDRGDNRPENLRAVTIFENNTKLSPRKKKKDNLPMGVYRCFSKFEARIALKGKGIWLGIFDTAEEAYEEYKSAKVRYHGPLSTLLLP